MKLPLAKIAELISGAGSFDGDPIAQGYSIDSRSIKPGQLFFAVKGERLDGHDYVQSALEKGAVTAVIEKHEVGRFPQNAPLIVVNNTLVALQTLATGVRRIWGKPLIAITGSAGKTTTKEAIAHLLATRHRILKSEGNFNNHFGLPLMLLKLDPEHDLAVIEMGMSHAGEIAALAAIARPETGVVTCVAPVHLEFFDSIAGIARAKYELVQSLPPSGTAVLNSDDEYVSKFGRDFRGKVVMFGLDPAANVRAVNIQDCGSGGSTFDVVVSGWQNEKATLPLVGRHNIHNALAAIAVALEHGLSLAEAVTALSSLLPADKRGQVTQVGDTRVINDCYNSNPKALDAMVDALAAMPAQRRIVVAGEMLELGPSGPELHRSSGRHMAERQIDCLIGVRGLAHEIVGAVRGAGMQAEFVNTPEEAGEWLARETRKGDVVLLKASRGVKLERALEIWKSHQGESGMGRG
jgi:UDP-N-acetylmuramoyl-tripeptide--D-alanyl-D-alanine ligase